VAVWPSVTPTTIDKTAKEGQMSTLANARDVLRLLASHPRDLTVTDVAAGLDAPKSSVSRTLGMMAEFGFLERDPQTLAYRPGPLILEAASHVRGSTDVVALLNEALVRLVDTTGYTGYLNLLEGGETLVIRMRQGRAGRLQAYTPEGTRGTAYASSSGRAILARLTDEDVSGLIGTRLEPAGSAPRTLPELLERLAQVRAEGWSLSRGESVHGVAGVASAVVDPTSGRPYGIGIGLPVQDLETTDPQLLGEAVRDAAQSVGRKVADPFWLGFPTTN